MKTLTTSYAFDPAARTIAFSDLSSQIVLEQVLGVINATRNSVLYLSIDPAYAGSTLVGNVLTLPAGVDTSAMSSADRLQIWLDIQDPADLIPTPVIVDTDAQPLVVSGKSADGMKRPVKVGADGGIQLSDGPVVPFVFDFAGPPGPIFDTTGYNSFVLQTAAGGSGADTRMYGSADGINWNFLSGVNLNTSGFTSVMYSAINIMSYPAALKYVRLQNSTNGTNRAGTCYIQMKAAQCFAAATSVTASGQAAQGAFAQSYQAPNCVAGVDGANLVRRLLTDTAGALAVGGVDPQSTPRRIATDSQGALKIVFPFADRTGPSIQELLLLILNELRVLNIMTHEMPRVLNAGEDMNAEFLLSDDSTTNLIS